MRQETRQAVRAIKERVRRDAYTLAEPTLAEMAAEEIDAADLKRAVSTARLVGLFRTGPRRTGYILLGFGMDEEAIEVLCSIGRSRVFIAGASRL